jgi:hypothetical protein
MTQTRPAARPSQPSTSLSRVCGRPGGRITRAQAGPRERKTLARQVGGQGWIRTSVRSRGQIYSLLPLTTRPPVRTGTTGGARLNRAALGRPAPRRTAAMAKPGAAVNLAWTARGWQELES